MDHNSIPLQAAFWLVTKVLGPVIGYVAWALASLGGCQIGYDLGGQAGALSPA